MLSEIDVYKRQEFIGRVPVTVSLNELDEEAMIRILKEPKLSLIHISRHGNGI